MRKEGRCATGGRTIVMAGSRHTTNTRVTQAAHTDGAHRWEEGVCGAVEGRDGCMLASGLRYTLSLTQAHSCSNHHPAGAEQADIFLLSAHPEPGGIRSTEADEHTAHQFEHTCTAHRPTQHGQVPSVHGLAHSRELACFTFSEEQLGGLQGRAGSQGRISQGFHSHRHTQQL